MLTDDRSLRNYSPPDQLILRPSSIRTRIFWLLHWCIIVGCVCLLLAVIPIVAAVILLAMLLPVFRYQLPVTPIFHPLIIRKEQECVFVGSKRFLFEELIFLSFHETENYRIIRLEGRRKHALRQMRPALWLDVLDLKRPLRCVAA